MKSRRVLQVIVAVLSLVVLLYLLLSAALVVAAQRLDKFPPLVVEWTNTFTQGLKNIALANRLEFAVVPAVAFGAPTLLLLLAIILILVKDNGKDAKNIVGCLFALIGVLILSMFLILFAKKLFEEIMLYPVLGASAGLLVLFVIFVGCALGVRSKNAPAVAVDDSPVVIVVEDDEETVEDESDEESVESLDEETDESVNEEVVEDESEEVVSDVEDEAVVSEEVEPTDDKIIIIVEDDDEPTTTDEVEEFNSELALDEKVRDAVDEREEASDDYEYDAATKYVPHNIVSVREVVEETYGRNKVSLSEETLKQIKRVRSLYEAKVLSKEEYLKLVYKYLEF